MGGEIFSHFKKPLLRDSEGKNNTFDQEHMTVGHSKNTQTNKTGVALYSVSPNMHSIIVLIATTDT